MIWYTLVAGILIYFFEIVGRYVLYILKIDKFKYCFGIGLIVFLAYSYVTTFLITALNGSFYLVSAIYSLFFVMFIVLIIKDHNNISFKVNLVNAVILILFVFIMITYAYNTTLGNIDGFDSTFYLNLVTTNIKSNPMNFSYWNNSIEQTYVSKTYTFQTYYYIASFLSYIFSNIIGIFHKTYYQTTYIWIFQILFNAFYYSLIANSIDAMKNKNKIVSIFIILFFLLVYGRMYYYNVFGFYGNTYRIITVGYTTLLLYLLIKDNKNSNLMMLFIASLLASASVSSSSLFINIFILFSAYFVLCKKYDNILKFYSIALLFILINLLSVSLETNIIYSILLSFVVFVILFIFGNKINSLLSKKKVLVGMLVISIAFMFISSALTTKNIFDFSSFFANHTETADMTINYFNLGTYKTYFLLKVFILFLLISSLLSLRKEKFIQFTFILFLCIFNPFCCSFIYKILIVYFRAFDIIVNPFTIILYIDLLIQLFKNNTIFNVTLCAFITFITIQNNFSIPVYYHQSFIPEFNNDALNYTNYNKEFKMSQDEKETIDTIFEDVKFHNITEPYIISPSRLMKGFVPSGKYIYGRSYWHIKYDSTSEQQLYSIFFPERYLGDHVDGVTPKYSNIKEYIDEAKIDYLVVDKTKEYFDTDLNTYVCLYLKVSEYLYPMFENNRYIIYRCFYQ